MGGRGRRSRRSPRVDFGAGMSRIRGASLYPPRCTGMGLGVSVRWLEEGERGICKPEAAVAASRSTEWFFLRRAERGEAGGLGEHLSPAPSRNGRSAGIWYPPQPPAHPPTRLYREDPKPSQGRRKPTSATRL
ncbi:hypothetical protein WMY93_025845 [Mugilogobius chulae]|uniref:Uncharacterized protein n=1 Tax=Mugilogobius chulae TaxID=88201 RepID=A0AAW0MXG0_9GOBI